MNRNTRLVAVLAVALLAATVASFVVYRALAAGSGVAAAADDRHDGRGASPFPPARC